MMQKKIYYYARNGKYGWVVASPGYVLARGLSRVSLKEYKKGR
jgi:hypothetical protein